MQPKERKKSTLGKGMELIRDGIEFSGDLRGGVSCICSPGGWSYGNVDVYRCACGCLYWPDGGGSSPEDNRDANHNLAVPEQ